MLRRMLAGGFVILVMVLLGLAAARVDWREVWSAMTRLPASVLGQAAVVTLASYLVYGCYDLLGKRYTGHKLSWGRSYLIGMAAYAFLMSLGSSVAGLAMRLRLYTGAGVPAGDALRVFGLAVATNWIGYFLIAGGVFLFRPLALPEDWSMGGGALRVAGAAMLLLALAYTPLCFLARKREWRLWGQHRVSLPSGRLAMLQAPLALANWCLMGLVLYVLLQYRQPYLVVLQAILVSAVAGLVIRLPAGLGVLETVAVALLATPELPKAQVLASVLAYRAVYYLAPLFLAAVWYLLREARLRLRDGGDAPA
jgi:uncharacterized membrane protein YbhN (UPF0104 family)